MGLAEDGVIESCASTSAKRSSIAESSLLSSSSSELEAASISLTTSLACVKKAKNCSFLKVSQNSNCAVLWRRFFTRSTSFAPGNSTKIRPEVPKR